MRRNFRAWAAVAVLLLSGDAMAKETTATLSVSGWHCGGCSAATEASIKAVSGVTSAKADLSGGTVKVTYDDSKASVADLEKAVEKAGYTVIRQ